MPDLPDWIAEYVEWERGNGRTVTSERIERLKQVGYVLVAWIDESGKPQGRTFGTAPELSEQQLESLFTAVPFPFAKAVVALLDKKIQGQ